MDLNSLSPGLIIVLVVSLALAPFVMVMVTSFTKIVIVLSLLRNALGLQQTPPNVVINGLAIILSVYIMYPVVLDTQDRVTLAAAEMQEGNLDLTRLLTLAEQGKAPLKDFLIRHASDDERSFFLASAQRLLPEQRRHQVSADDFIVIVPAFVVQELTTAFQIGFLIFLPFLIIDLIVSNILMALGMMMLAPTMVSLPFKLLLFVFVNGWTHLIHGLVLTYV